MSSSHPAPERRWTLPVCSCGVVLTDQVSHYTGDPGHVRRQVVVIPEQEAEQLREENQELRAEVEATAKQRLAVYELMRQRTEELDALRELARKDGWLPDDLPQPSSFDRELRKRLAQPDYGDPAVLALHNRRLRGAVSRLVAAVAWTGESPESDEAEQELIDAKNEAVAALEEKGKLDG